MTRLVAALAGLILLGACVVTRPHVQPAPVDLTRWEADCRAVYQQELGREADPDGLVACEQRMAAATGPVIPQEQFRAWVREQPEWAQHQKDLEAAKVVVLPRQRARGQFIELDNGQWFTVIETSDFALYQRHLENDPGLETVLAQREQLGFNSVRIFGVGIISFPGYSMNLTPARYGERYYTELAPFHQRLARHHLYSDWVAFVGRIEILSDTDQFVHWTRLVDALRPITNVRLSAMNEDNVHPLPTLFKLPKPVGVFTSHGSNGGAPGGANGADPPVPHWDWIELHTNDTFERQRKVGHNCMELSATRPCVASENTRGGDRMTRLEEARDSAAGAALLAGGSTYHSLQGRISVPFTGLELELAKAWVAGAKSIPLSCQAGPYFHRQQEIDEERTGNFLRVYRRGSDPACVARIRR